MVKLSEVIEQNKEVMQEEAHRLGLSSVALFKPGVDGVLGIYAVFDKAIGDADDYSSRCLSLTYKISELTNCIVVVASNKDPMSNPIKDKTVSLQEISSPTFKKIYLAPANEVFLDSRENDLSYQSKMTTYKIFYDQISKISSFYDAKKEEDVIENRQNSKVAVTFSEPKLVVQDSRKRHFVGSEEMRQFLSDATDEEYRDLLKELDAERQRLKVAKIESSH